MYAGLFKNRCHLPDGTVLDSFCYIDDNCDEFELDCGSSGCDDG